MSVIGNISKIQLPNGDIYGIQGCECTPIPYETLKKIISTDDSILWYGIEYDTTVSAPEVTRIGNLNLHRELPIQNKMRGCLLADDGSVVEYLPADSWLNSVRDGSMGQVMVELPGYFFKEEHEGTKVRWKISEFPLDGFSEVKKQYISSYQATVDRTTSTYKLSSVYNTTAAFRGGNGVDSTCRSWDNQDWRTLLGKPATVLSLTAFRSYARNRGINWSCAAYGARKTLYRFFVIEYGTRNSQASYNAQLDINGYHQGGLGAGVTNYNSTNWYAWFDNVGYYPTIPCGYTDSLGNSTGYVTYTFPTDTGKTVPTSSTNVPRYRGVENPFGYIWEWTDGVLINVTSSKSEVYTCYDPTKYASTITEDYTYVGDEIRSDGYVKALIAGEIIPEAIGGASNTYFCDYHYQNASSGSWVRGVLFGGASHHGSYAGFLYAYSHYAPSYTSTNIGSRLCFSA